MFDSSNHSDPQTKILRPSTMLCIILNTFFTKYLTQNTLKIAQRKVIHWKKTPADEERSWVSVWGSCASRDLEDWFCLVVFVFVWLCICDLLYLWWPASREIDGMAHVTQTNCSLIFCKTPLGEAEASAWAKLYTKIILLFIMYRVVFPIFHFLFPTKSS